jgi:hypothetical protein
MQAALGCGSDASAQCQSDGGDFQVDPAALDAWWKMVFFLVLCIQQSRSYEEFTNWIVIQDPKSGVVIEHRIEARVTQDEKWRVRLMSRPTGNYRPIPFPVDVEVLNVIGVC